MFKVAISFLFIAFSASSNLDGNVGMIRKVKSPSHAATFTYYTDFGGDSGQCQDGNDAAALDDCSWLWQIFRSTPCPPPNNAKCVCPDGSSCPHDPFWQCDAIVGDWSPLTNCWASVPQLHNCSFDAVGPAGTKTFRITAACPLNHPCNACRTGGKCPDQKEKVHLDLCKWSVAGVCGGYQGCEGYITNISCYPN